MARHVAAAGSGTKELRLSTLRAIGFGSRRLSLTQLDIESLRKRGTMRRPHDVEMIARNFMQVEAALRDLRPALAVPFTTVLSREDDDRAGIRPWAVVPARRNEQVAVAFGSLTVRNSSPDQDAQLVRKLARR